jgi:hypothetical protein
MLPVLRAQRQRTSGVSEMKPFLIWWAIGCLVTGLVVGMEKARCPNDTVPTAVELLTGVAIFPALMISALFILDRPETPCRGDRFLQDPPK